MSCAPTSRDAEELLNTAAWTTDRYNSDRKPTFKDGYPQTGRLSFNKKFCQWKESPESELIERYNNGSLSGPSSGPFWLSSRLNWALAS